MNVTICCPKKKKYCSWFGTHLSWNSSSFGCKVQNRLKLKTSGAHPTKSWCSYWDPNISSDSLHMSLLVPTSSNQFLSWSIPPVCWGSWWTQIHAHKHTHTQHTSHKAKKKSNWDFLISDAMTRNTWGQWWQNPRLTDVVGTAPMEHLDWW